MEPLHYFYLPKDERIVYKQVDRPAGFSRNSIHMHDHHELVLVASNSDFTLISNGIEQSVSGPCMIFHKAGSFHEAVKINKGNYNSCVLFYHPQAITDIPEKYLYAQQLFHSDLTIISLTNEDLVSVYPLFDLISSRPYEQQLPLLLTIFASAHKIIQNGANVIYQNATASYIFEIIELLQEVQEDLSLTELAERYHVSPTKLKTDFKRITGIPVIAYKNKMRLEKTRILLLSGDLSQAQIAYTCGYADESYFIRAFKQQYQVTPAVYRRKMKESIKTT